MLDSCCCFLIGFSRKYRGSIQITYFTKNISSHETIKLQSSFSPNILQVQLSIACDGIQTRGMENNAGLLKCVPAIAFESQLRLTQL
jgi:hypothetical protein